MWQGLDTLSGSNVIYRLAQVVQANLLRSIVNMLDTKSDWERLFGLNRRYRMPQRHHP